jgi:hypothetical protein
MYLLSRGANDACRLFGDPDGVNFLSSTTSSATNPLFTGILNSVPVPLLGGLFSIGLRATPGSVANFPSVSADNA